ncbi:MAG TPA: VOC family protein [Nocardioidaceae bacterium]|jgi:uncharacterized glyoxalase superfamily protein PhnB
MIEDMPTSLITQLTPRLVVAEAAKAIDFYCTALGADEQERFEVDGAIAHARVTIDGLDVALKDADEFDLAPPSLGGTPVIISLTVTDADAVGQRMVDAGATVVFEVGDRDYGFRDGRLRDPFGHLWIVSQPLR